IAMTAHLEVGSEIGVIVDFPVEDEAMLPRFTQHRLLAGRHVDDRQAPMAQSHAVAGPESSVVRAAIRDDVAHPSQARLIDEAAVERHDADDSAHALMSLNAWS